MALSLEDATQAALAEGATFPMELDASVAKLLERKHPIWDSKHVTWREIDYVLYDRMRENRDHFIPKGSDETPVDYARRVEFARFKGELAPLIERLVGAVFETPPTRPQELQNSFAEFIKNVDGSHRALNKFMEDRLYELFGFGAAPFIVDRPATDEEGNEVGITSKGFLEVPADREVPDSEIRLTPYKIFQIVDWDPDSAGELNWVRIHEERRIATPQESRVVDIYREWDRTAWRVFHVEKEEESGGKKKVWMVGFGFHDLGMVPLVIPHVRQDGPMDFFTPFQYGVHFDIENFRSDADLQYNTWLHANATILDGRADQSKGRVTVGPHAQVKVNPEYSEEVTYMDFPDGSMDQLRKNKKEALDGLRRSVGIDGTSVDQNSSQMQSGRAKAIAFSMSEKRSLENGADAMEMGEKRMWELGERWRSDDEDTPPQESVTDHEVVYSKHFSMATAEQLVELWILARQEFGSETWDRQMQEKIVDATLGDISVDLRKKIVDEIAKADLQPEGQNPLLAAMDEPKEIDDAADAAAEEAARAQLSELQLSDLGR